MAVRPFFRGTRPCFRATMCRFRATRPYIKATRPCFRATMCRFRATARDRPYYIRGAVVDGVGLQAVGEAQAEDEAFQEGVAGEPVCAVYACTRDFPNGIEAEEG